MPVSRTGVLALQHGSQRHQAGDDGGQADGDMAKGQGIGGQGVMNVLANGTLLKWSHPAVAGGRA